MRAYEKYVKGVYYQNSEFKSPITPEKQQVLDALKKGYPNALSAKDLMEHNIEESSAYTLSKALAKEQFIIPTTERDKKSKRKVKKYYFEDVNYIYNLTEGFKLPFAPGYVEYEKSFLDIYEKIRDKDLEAKIEDSLLNFLMPALREKKSSGLLCKNCGYDHERRDFIRATLLHLIDGLETNRQFINFIKSQEIINDTTYRELITVSEESTPKNDRQEAAEIWFNRISPKAKKIVKKILKEKPSMTKEQIMTLIGIQSQGGTIKDEFAAYRVMNDLGISISRRKEKQEEGEITPFNFMSPRIKKLIEKILIMRPTITKEHLINLIHDKQRKLNTDRNNVTDIDALSLVMNDLGFPTY